MRKIAPKNLETKFQNWLTCNFGVIVASDMIICLQEHTVSMARGYRQLENVKVSITGGENGVKRTDFAGTVKIM